MMRRVLIILLIVLLAPEAAEAQRFYRVKRLPFSTGSYWESAPVPYAGGLVYNSNMTESSYVKYTNEENQSFTNIYFVASDGDNWGDPEYFSEQFKSRFDDGPVTFAREGEMICFHQAYVNELGMDGRRSNPNGGLYFSELTEGEWSEPEPFEHNDYDYTYYTPHLSGDGNTLYFSANLDDSRGDFDIYVSYFKNGRWTAPENLGDNINTEAREWFPFLHASGRLYFSSDGHDRTGGFDIFYCNNIEGVFSEAIKLQTPINSGADDVALIMSDDFTEGYFASNRVGSTPDIYSFSSSFPKFDFPSPVRKNRFCFRLRENSLDTIDYSVFQYEWVINDTLTIPGHDIKYCFPGPGDYQLSFNVTNKLTDTVMYDVASLFLQLELIEQAVITSPDTVQVNETVTFGSEQTHLPNFEIDGFYWDFGDGMKGSGRTATNVYTYPGTFRVVLGVEERVRNRRFEPERIAVYKDIVVVPAE